MALLESFCPSGLLCECQADHHANPYFPWLPETLREDVEKTPLGIQADPQDDTGPTWLGSDTRATENTTSHYALFASLSQSRDVAVLGSGTGTAPLGL